MRRYLTALALMAIFATPAAAGFAGTESRGQPINSSVYLPAIDPDTGYMPRAYESGWKSRAQSKAKKKSKKKRAY